MNDVLRYMQRDPIHRRDHQSDLTFGMLYAYCENFVLPLSHDEVVHGKRSLLSKMPGDAWQQLANLRLLYGFMYGHPGKKLLFMGAELAQCAKSGITKARCPGTCSRRRGPPRRLSLARRSQPALSPVRGPAPHRRVPRWF